MRALVKMRSLVKMRVSLEAQGASWPIIGNASALHRPRRPLLLRHRPHHPCCLLLLQSYRRLLIRVKNRQVKNRPNPNPNLNLNPGTFQSAFILTVDSSSESSSSSSSSSDRPPPKKMQKTLGKTNLAPSPSSPTLSKTLSPPAVRSPHKPTQNGTYVSKCPPYLENLS